MADNVAITAGSGTTILADELTDGTLGSGKAQYVKVMDGTLDSSNKWLINSDGSASFVGNVASGATDSGNPVKVGGKYNATPPTFSDGQRGDMQVDLRGSAKVSLRDTDGAIGAQISGLAGDGGSPGGGTLYTSAFNWAFNGSTWDRIRSAAKGTQATNALATQDLKDSGRTLIHYYTEAYSVTGSEALATITGVNRGATNTATQLTVTSGKTLRVQAITATAALLGTTVTATTLRLRVNLSGAATTSSPIFWETRIGNASVGTQAANYGVAPIHADFPDGLEFPATAGLQFTAIATTTAMHALTLSLVGYEY